MHQGSFYSLGFCSATTGSREKPLGTRVGHAFVSQISLKYKHMYQSKNIGTIGKQKNILAYKAGEDIAHSC